MSFVTELAAAAGTLTAAQIAAATGASKRTVENWRAGRNEPVARECSALLTRIKRARARAERKRTVRNADP
jgi:DNA-binding transcriptional regulator YiaG